MNMKNFMTKNAIKEQFAQVITSSKQANTLITKAGASAVAWTLHEKNGDFIMSLHAMLEADLPKHAVLFKQWVLSTAPLMWHREDKRIKFSQKEFDAYGKSIQDIHDDMLVNDYGTFKNKNIVKEPTPKITQDKADKQIKALNNRLKEAGLPEIVQGTEPTPLEKAVQILDVSTKQGLAEALGKILSSPHLEPEDLSYLAKMAKRIADTIPVKTAGEQSKVA